MNGSVNTKYTSIYKLYRGLYTNTPTQSELIAMHKIRDKINNGCKERGKTIEHR